MQERVLPYWPPSFLSKWFFGIALLSYLVSLFFQSQMWLVEFGFYHPMPEGGEYLLAFFLGLPSLMVVILCSGTVVTVPHWRCRSAEVLLAFSLVPMLGWLVIGVEEIIRNL